MKKINLIISKNDYLWKNKHTNLLVGDWCLPDKKFFFSFNYKVADDYIETSKNILKDQQYIKKIYNTLLKNISENLNKYHSTHLPQRYWEILINPWLIYLIETIFIRWKTIEKIKKKNKNLETNIDKYQDEYFVANNTKDSHLQVLSNNWNHWINSKIIRHIGGIKIIDNKIEKKFMNSKNSKKKRKILFKVIIKNNHQVFMKNFYLPKFPKLLLNLSYKQLRYKFDQPELNQFKINRKRFTYFKKIKSQDKFLNFINEIALSQIPKVFVEGYLETKNKVKYLNWPKNPKIILTSIEFYINEFFKFYTAQKMLFGSKLVIGQHGMGNIDKYNLFTYYEKKICNRFLSWGKNSNDRKIYPLFATTVSKKKIVKDSSAQGLIIPLYDFFRSPTRIVSVPHTDAGLQKYFQNINIFLSNVDKRIISKSTLKYGYQYRNKISCEHLLTQFPKLSRNTEANTSRLYEQSHKFKLNIETHHSTGFFESLNLNIPTIVMVDKKYFNIASEYKKYFNYLIKAKIIYFSPLSAAKFVNKNYNNIELWWQSKLVQNTRKKVCDYMCRSSVSPIKDIRKSLIFKN